ncbi:MAG: hypothetical protein R8M46_09005 [Ghiorsea sp.]
MAAILAATQKLGRVRRMTLATLLPVKISKSDFQTMLDFSRAIYQLKCNENYLETLDLQLPETAAINPSNPSLLMGYDFHLTDNGPKLIEINNNAGGLFEKDDGWIPQCTNTEMTNDLKSRINQMFPESWQHIAIMDESVTEQYMFPEMLAYASLLEEPGRKVSLVSPEDLMLKEDGLYVNGLKVDAIYNRHTDFYLDSEPMQDIRVAFMGKQVALNPYPRSYALIGDKNRMVDWWRQDILEAIVDGDTLKLIRDVVPETHLLSEYNTGDAWSARKSWVFKPAARHGGKGVLLGKAMSRKRFDGLETATTVMQKLVPPSKIDIDGKSFKFDVRFYMHGANLIAMSGRAWNGQITNFREEGSGWTAIEVEK